MWSTDVSRDVDEEISFHIEALADAHERSGLTRDVAMAKAVSEFGDIGRAKQECVEIDDAKRRRERRGKAMSGLADDIRHGLRMLRRSPGFAAAALVVLGLGIGGNAALFAAMSSLFLHPAPGVAADAQRVWIVPYSGARPTLMSYPDYSDYAARTELFEMVAAWDNADMSVSTGGLAEHRRGQFVSPDYFRAMGVRPVVGRDFTAGDGTGESGAVALIGERLWRDVFGSEAGVQSTPILLNGQPFTVIGVIPAEFTGAETGDEASIWIPLSTVPLLYPARRDWLTERGTGWLNVMGRLRPGVTAAAAASALTAFAARNHEDAAASDGGMSVAVSRARSGLRPGQSKESIPIFAVAAGVTLLVLLIACSNFATLLIGRGVTRRTELAVRSSLGASSGRIARMLLTEILLFTIGGGVLGVVLSYWILAFVKTLMPPGAERFVLRPDALTTVAAVLLAVVTGIVFGLVPALDASRPQTPGALSERTTSGGVRASRMRRGLVVAQVSLSFVLLALAGLFLRSMRAAMVADVGFDAKPAVLAASFDLAVQGYSPSRAEVFRDELLRRAGALPGVDIAMMADNLPLSNRMFGTSVTTDASQSDKQPRTTYLTHVTPGYFRTIGNPLVAGRDFNERDDRSAPLAVIVNEAFVRAYFGEADPLGARLNVGGDGPPDRAIVGVAKDAMYHDIGEAARPYIFLPMAQDEAGEFGPVMLVLRASDGSAAGLANSVRQLFATLDPSLPVSRMVTMDVHVREKVADRRLGVSLVSLFGAIALMLSAIGLYGLAAFSVSRARERSVCDSLLAHNAMRSSACSFTRACGSPESAFSSGLCSPRSSRA